MSDTTKIQWADATFNPWIGCTKVSPGCAHCYAENTTRARVLRSKGQETWGRGAQRSRTSAATWKNPVRWNSEVAVHPDYGHKVFASLCDWLDDEVPIEWLADFLKLIRDTPHLDWLLLTKRPENFHYRLRRVLDCCYWGKPGAVAAMPGYHFVSSWQAQGKSPENVWVGTSVENQAMAEKRIPELLKIPAKVRFLSVEPMLEEIDLRLDSVRLIDLATAAKNPPKIHWVIFGGESGSKARPCNVEWIRDGVRQCRAADVPVFVKQLGSDPRHDYAEMIFTGPLSGSQKVRINNGPLRLKDKKGGDMAEWPEDLRVRKFPTQ